MKPRHRVATVRQAPDRASDAEALALLKACRSARDRLLVLLLARAGLRRGEVVGLRRADVHFLIDSSALGCSASAPSSAPMPDWWTSARTPVVAAGDYRPGPARPGLRHTAATRRLRAGVDVGSWSPVYLVRSAGSGSDGRTHCPPTGSWPPRSSTATVEAGAVE